MIASWDRKYPGRSMNMVRAMGRISLSHMLDRRLYDFDSDEIIPGAREEAEMSLPENSREDAAGE